MPLENNSVIAQCMGADSVMRSCKDVDEAIRRIPEMFGSLAKAGEHSTNEQIKDSIKKASPHIRGFNGITTSFSGFPGGTISSGDADKFEAALANYIKTGSVGGVGRGVNPAVRPNPPVVVPVTDLAEKQRHYEFVTKVQAELSKNPDPALVLSSVQMLGKMFDINNPTSKDLKYIQDKINEAGGNIDQAAKNVAGEIIRASGIVKDETNGYRKFRNELKNELANSLSDKTPAEIVEYQKLFDKAFSKVPTSMDLKHMKAKYKGDGSEQDKAALKKIVYDIHEQKKLEDKSKVVDSRETPRADSRAPAEGKSRLDSPPDIKLPGYEDQIRDAVNKNNNIKNKDDATKTLCHLWNTFDKSEKLIDAATKKLCSDGFMGAVERGDNFSIIFSALSDVINTALELKAPVEQTLASLFVEFEVPGSKDGKRSSIKQEGLLKPVLDGLKSLKGGEDVKNPQSQSLPGGDGGRGRSNSI